MNAAEVMTRNVVTVARSAPIREAIRLMLDNKVSGLPVVDAGGKVDRHPDRRRSVAAQRDRHRAAALAVARIPAGAGADGERIRQNPRPDLRAN